MVLATRCPHCHTTFRVVHDQLKLRAGLVRCGACKEIFNGVENLLAPPPAADAQETDTREQTTPASTTQASVDTEQAEPAPAEESADAAEPQDQAAENPEENTAGPAAEAPAQHSVESAPASVDPLLRMTLLDIAQEGPPRPTPEPADEIDQAIDDLHNKPWRGTRDYSLPMHADAIDALDEDEPEFVTLARHRKRLARRVRIFLILGSALLALTLAFQALVQFRNQISARLPVLVPALEALCDVADCQLGLPMQIQHLTLESSELQILPNDGQSFTLAILLRNRSSLQQAWPHLELSLNDAQDQPVVRRVLAPADYLPAGVDAAGGFPGQSEQAARIGFTLSDTQASGYRLYLFYP